MIDQTMPLKRLVENLIENWPSETLEPLIKLSSDLLEMPVVWISLLTPSRLLRPVCLGLPLKDIALADRFCHQTLTQSDPLIVKDALDDPRFASLSLINAPYYLRFYAGIPLLDNTGRAFGTLSVMDRQTRQFENQDLRCLQMLARQIQEALMRVWQRVANQAQIPPFFDSQNPQLKTLTRPPRQFRSGTVQKSRPGWRPLGTLATQTGAESLALQRFYAAQAELQRMTLDASLEEVGYHQAGLQVLCDYFNLSQAALIKIKGQSFKQLALAGPKTEDLIRTFEPFLEELCHSQEVLTFEDFKTKSTPVSQHFFTDSALPQALIGTQVWLKHQLYGLVICSGSERKNGFSSLEQDFMRLFGRWLSFIIDRQAHTAHLKALNDSKDRVLAMVAHDLRNPLGTIVSASRMLARSEPDGLNAKMLKVIDQACLMGNQLIDELLDAAELEESTNLKQHPHNLCDFVNMIYHMFEPRAKVKTLELILELETEQAMVLIDEHKMSRVFENLLNNALKFTPVGGKIYMRLSKSKTKAYLQIEDSGIGIPPELQKGLFEKYSQARRQGLAGEKSNGLGMYIVKQITELHGGRIQVASLEGHGTVFQIELPLAPHPFQALPDRYLGKVSVPE